jgi:hypothetical protein
VKEFLIETLSALWDLAIAILHGLTILLILWIISWAVWFLWS